MHVPCGSTYTRYIRYTFSTRSFEWLFISFHFHRINCVRHGYSVCYRIWCSVRVSHIQGCFCFLQNNQEKPIEFSEHPKAVPINDIASKRLHNHLNTFTSFCELKQNECRSAQLNSLAHTDQMMMMMMICARRNIYSNDNKAIHKMSIHFVHFETWKLRVYFIFSGLLFSSGFCWAAKLLRTSISSRLFIHACLCRIWNCLLQDGNV